MEISNNDLIVSVYKKWLYQERGIDDLSLQEIGIIDIIIETSFRYGCKYAYLGLNEFKMAKITAIKYLKKLKNKKIIEYKNSFDENGLKRKNKYTLLYPDYLNFKFYCKQQKEESEETEIPQL